jgi:hypothetical protein
MDVCVALQSRKSYDRMPCGAERAPQFYAEMIQEDLNS